MVPDAINIDLYDRVDKITFDKLTNFFLSAFHDANEAAGQEIG